MIDRRHRSSVPDPTAYPDPGHILIAPKVVVRQSQTLPRSQIYHPVNLR
ncbi:hypothetical protein SXCC_00252 [Gluconacetobacter sp. SXCC-1]|nr:hypothetical protein SXCC_00276 [Gluconacetobacter sp. SXCC-1]EGG79069.1 hypothetical protein SXCC_00252 [Gluconacetobacter sp. SXCC-1]